jgi:hypothetical protein
VTKWVAKCRHLFFWTPIWLGTPTRAALDLPFSISSSLHFQAFMMLRFVLVLSQAQSAQREFQLTWTLDTPGLKTVLLPQG